MIIMAWTSHEAGVQSVHAQQKTVMCCQWNCYFDIYENLDQANESIEARFAKWPVDLKSVYEYDPYTTPFKKVNQTDWEKYKKYILGTQGLLWTEFVRSESELQFKLYPRMLAIAEVAWTSVKQKNYQNFVLRLKGYMQYFAQQKIIFSKEFL